MDEKLNPLFDTVNPKRNQSPSEALIERIRAAQTANMGRQQDLIGQTQGKIAELEKKPKATDYSALMAASDMLTGTQLLPAYRHIKEPDTSKEELLQMRGLLGKQYEQLSDSELGALKAEYDALTDAKKFDMMEKMYSSKASAVEDKPSFGQKKLDEAFAKDYSAWTQGGFAKTAANMDSLKDVIGKLSVKDGKEYGKSFLPDFVRAASDPEGLALQQAVELVSQEGMKEILGGQFGEKEGMLLTKRSYDPRLSNSQNLVKVQRLYKKIAVAAKKKQEAMDYFEANDGSLKGYKGNSSLSLHDFNEQLKKEILAEDDDDKTVKDDKDKKAPPKDPFDDLPGDEQDALKKQFNL